MEDGMTVVSGMTELSSMDEDINEQDLRGFEEHPHESQSGDPSPSDSATISTLPPTAQKDKRRESGGSTRKPREAKAFVPADKAVRAPGPHPFSCLSTPW